jgi:hypothetical protein
VTHNPRQAAQDEGHPALRPYWRRAHHDWRFWLAMVLMAAAISTYVMTQDLWLVPRGERVQPGPGGLR